MSRTAQPDASCNGRAGEASKTALDAALDYIERGIAVVPVQPGSKYPVAHYWEGKRAATVTRGNAAKAFVDGRGVAAVLGAASGGLADFDLDCEEARALAPRFLPSALAVFGHSASPRSHWLCRSDLHEQMPKAFLKVEDMLELRLGGEKAITVLPPSLHDEGGARAWVNSEAQREFTWVEGEQLLRLWHNLAAATVGARYWPRDEGSRNEVVKAFSGFLARTGKLSADDALQVVEAVMDYANDDLKDRPSRLKTVRQTFQKHENGQKTTGLNTLRELLGEDATKKLAKLFNYGDDEGKRLEKMNAEYCVVQAGGKTRVLRFDPFVLTHAGREVQRREVPVFLSFNDFRNFHLNEFVWVEGKDGPEPKALGDWWLRHPQRRTYSGLTFEPLGEQVVNGRLNLWRGWAVPPKKGDWSLMRAHLEQVVAAGDAEASEYVLNWLSWTVQHRDQPAEVALVLQGDRGTGKGTLGNSLCRLFGQHSVHIVSREHLVGRFNDHLRDCCFLFADEAYWPGDKQAEGGLKALITEPTLLIEPKGLGKETVANRLHVLMATNDDWVVPAGEHERRFVVLRVSNGKRQDASWFGPLYRQLEEGGYAAMLYDLLERELGDWHPRRILRTEALRDQQLRSLAPMDQWVLGLLEDGELPRGTIPNRSNSPRRAISRSVADIDGRNPRNGLFDLARTNHPGLRHVDDQVLARHLQTFLGCVKCKVNKQRRGWEFPPLSECRTKWEQKYPGWRWQDPELTEWLDDGVSEDAGGEY